MAEQKYYLDGKSVELVPGQQFDSHWNILVHGTTPEGKTTKRTMSVHPDKLKTTAVDIPVIGNPSIQPTNLLNINEASFTDIRQYLPGVGRVTAKAIVENKPSGGYRSLEHMQEVNNALKLNWDTVSNKISF